ncbi:SRPBCC domain-containing protein [Zhihengliuella salsuginis]|uniref:Activator of Hsp90 ATPase homologue 1/2-like C-terminal domain-containing protein n=1 Tax=Zhihengliuella salsuginis TaxID=578222 RepID=A0ABQ3GL02_9MICC|nr:SRPBCC domain-containing protein [Zhihengliuella salsuginis]GHD10694.1 hypothetical protein GCM10008096_24550 [Zhihengliuella salsuginis]
MQGLFSHAPTPDPDPTPDEDSGPLRFTVRVPVADGKAFEGFTEYIHLWWPADEYSRFGSGTHMSLDQDGLAEETDSGEHCQWASLHEATAPTRLELRCTYDFEDLPPSRVVVTFVDEGGETDVTLTHDHLSAGADGRRQSEAYSFWAEILGRFGRFMGAG